ncbi:serine/threonine phosphatase stp [mine drainage metagenome]|uniref:Serine/threonine phosphatase stp n=1 Tax=mine drainage metagenome TaxID=410659 RepID=A0A1J5SG61_9ZZZZ
MKFTIYQESRIGRRASNQDRIAYCYSRDALLMVVADGMGGHLHGELAAHIAVQYITGSFKREARPALDDPIRFLARALAHAHQAIIDFAAERGLPEAPRTTCVACVVQRNVAHWAHAGDSRLYLLRGQRLLAQTRDHSRVQMMLDQGLIDAAAAASHPDRNRVFSCLGGNHAPQLDLSHKTPLRAGDIIALCSDGVWAPLGSDLLVRSLAGANPMLSVPRLLDLAGARAGENGDNLSLIAMQWGESYSGNTPSNVSTKTMPLDAINTEMGEAGMANPSDFSEDEIERAINEIRTAIQKFSD